MQITSLASVAAGDDRVDDEDAAAAGGVATDTATKHTHSSNSTSSLTHSLTQPSFHTTAQFNVRAHTHCSVVFNTSI